MKLLFDQNLSHRLVAILHIEFSGSVHVRQVGMAEATDSAVWSFAATRGFALVSKDVDFQQRALLLGCPPKVIWIRLGNCLTDSVATLLRSKQSEISAFDSDSSASFLALA